MICDYLGLRREESAGLAVADVMQDADAGLWTIDVRANKFRQLKRTWTARRLPIHEELLRLGFLEYVEAIRALGYEPLFPDLLPTTPGSPLVDQLANGWVKIEMGAFPDGKPEKRVFRSYRHSFNDELKNAGVSLEMRRELMGHRRHLGASVVGRAVKVPASRAIIILARDAVIAPMVTPISIRRPYIAALPITIVVRPITVIKKPVIIIIIRMRGC